jgi:hypothetical protein
VKNQHSNVEHILRELSARRIDRQSYALAIGGGAMLDAAGAAPGKCRRRHQPRANLGERGTQLINNERILAQEQGILPAKTEIIAGRGFRYTQPAR